MRNKRFLSTVVATALVATTMAMPVMAADEGSFEVDVTTKTGILRVQVPTSMAMAVDQFEIAHTGTQITAGEFDMTNLSEMDVKVKVTSEATQLGSGISLVSTAKAAEESTKDGEAWLGIATKTNDGSTNSGKCYDDPETGTDADPNVEEYWDLSDENSNVTSFANDTKKAEQTFYLAKGTGNAAYKLALPDATGFEKPTYAKFYELTEKTLASNDNDGLQAAVDVSDVYAIATTDVANDGATVTKIEKGATISTANGNEYAGTNKYYTAADDASAALTTGSSKLYVYAAMASDGGKAGFTYIGKLSPKQETWTNSDIKKIKVKYEIGGVTGTRYDEVKDDCTYGLYKEAAKGPKVSVSATGLITVSGLTSEQNYTGMTIVDEDGMTKTQSDKSITWNLTNWNTTDGGTFTAQLPEGWVTYWSGKEITVTVGLTDKTSISAKATL